MTWRNRPAGSGAPVGRGRRTVATAAAVVAAVVGALGFPGVARAAVTTFSMTPGAGPPGTVVRVSGTGCSPGLLGSSDTDFVTVSAITLEVTIRIPVTSSGAWQGSFTVPAGAPTELPAPVFAVCTSGSLQSLFTVYLPQTFTVTGETATTTVPVPVTTSTTLPAAPGPPVGNPSGGATGGNGPTTTVPRVAPGPHDPGVREPTTTPVRVPGRGIATPGGGGVPVTIGTGDSRVQAPAGPAPESSARPGAREVAARGSRRVDGAARSATLQPVGIDVPASGDSGSWSWVSWSLLAALMLAVLGAPAWLWSRRERPANACGDDA